MLKLDKKQTFLFLILLGAVLLRLIAVQSVPPSLNWDEVSHGYNAYSILMTGKDEWGVTLPTIFRAYGDYKLPVYIYLTTISEAIFGLSVFSVRLVSIFAGIATVIFTYLLTRKWFGQKTALFATLLVAISPWSLFLSRGAFEANLSLALIVSGTYFFTRDKKKSKNLIISSILFGLSLWTYNSARVFVPPLVGMLIFLNIGEFRKLFKKEKKSVLIASGIFLFFLVPMVLQLLNPSGQARYGWVAIVDEGAIGQIEQARVASDLAPLANRFVNNRYTYFAKEFVGNWFAHFSPEFLFFSGGTHYQFSVPGEGLLYLLNIFFLPIGLIQLLRKRDKKSWILMGWLLLAPIPSSLTREAPHVLRSITMLPIPMILSAVGVVRAIKYFEKRYKKYGGIIFTSLYLVLLFVFAEDYITKYFQEYPVNYSWSWQYGYEEVVNYSKENYEEYDKIIVSKIYGEPHEFFLFYWPWDPADYRNDEKLVRFFQSDWYWVDRFDKFYFVNEWEVPRADDSFVLESGEEFDCKSENCLLITSKANHPVGWEKLETINFLDGSVAFEIYEN